MKHLHINMETANHQCLFRANVKRNRGRYGQASLQWNKLYLRDIIVECGAIAELVDEVR